VDVVVVDHAADAQRVAADLVATLLAQTPTAVLGLATGATPLGLYEELIRRHRHAGLRFAQAQAFLLDEYVGLPADHPARFRSVIDRVFIRHVDVPAAAVHGPDTLSEDLDAAAAEYDRAIADAGGIDLQVLGIGPDGHLAFNMPGASLTGRTRRTVLSAATRQANARWFGGDPALVPTEAVTQGLGTIMESRRAVLLGLGAAKAEAVRACVDGPVSTDCPASVLQRHPHATVVVDRAASSRLGGRR
jgi:glucosamine-6-phosphate isomerase